MLTLSSGPPPAPEHEYTLRTRKDHQKTAPNNPDKYIVPEPFLWYLLETFGRVGRDMEAAEYPLHILHE